MLAMQPSGECSRVERQGADDHLKGTCRPERVAGRAFGRTAWYGSAEYLGDCFALCAVVARRTGAMQIDVVHGRGWNLSSIECRLHRHLRAQPVGAWRRQMIGITGLTYAQQRQRTGCGG